MPVHLDIDSPKKFTGRLGVQQRILPVYRVPFFDALAQVSRGGLQLFAGEPLKQEGVTQATEVKGAKIHRTRNRNLFDPSSPLYLCWQDGLLTWLKSWQPDVVIMEANPRYLSTYGALKYLRKNKKGIIGWGLGAPRIKGIPGMIYNLQRKGFIRIFDALIAYSHKGAREFRALGIPQERIFVAPNAVAHRPEKPPPDRSGNQNKIATVLFVGRLQQRKKVDTLIRACSGLPKEIQPHLWLVGDGPARLELETLAREIYPRTEFLGSIHGQSLVPIFADADLFVLPGTGGLAVQEAMANGLPVIVARGDGTQEDLVRQENGWQVPDDDLPALEQALRQALSNPVTLRRMGEESFRIVKNEINIETMVSVFLEAVLSVSESINPVRK